MNSTAHMAQAQPDQTARLHGKRDVRGPMRAALLAVKGWLKLQSVMLNEQPQCRAGVTFAHPRDRQRGLKSEGKRESRYKHQFCNPALHRHSSTSTLIKNQWICSYRCPTRNLHKTYAEKPVRAPAKPVPPAAPVTASPPGRCADAFAAGG